MRTLASVGFVLAGLIVGAGPANAASTGEMSPNVTPDGNFYAEADQGYICSWSGNGADWSYSENGANCLNNVIWVENNGYVEDYDCVELYWGTGYYGAATFVSQGVSWDLTTGAYTFGYEGTGTSGYGEDIENNVASSAWVPPAPNFC